MGAFGFGFVVGFTASVVFLLLNERKEAGWAVELPVSDEEDEGAKSVENAGASP